MPTASSEVQVLGGGWSDRGFRAQVGGRAKASTLTGLGRVAVGKACLTLWL